MALDRDKFRKFAEEVKSGMGGDFVGEIDKIDEAGQFAFATSEPDRGETYRGKWIDLIEEKLDKHGFRPVPVMPFPVSGRLVYVLGMRRLSRAG